MFEAEIQKYVKEGHKALPCKAAKNAFDRYIELHSEYSFIHSLVAFSGKMVHLSLIMR